MTESPHVVAVIGAGPVGLAAAAHLASSGIEPLVFEAGEQVGASVREWGHVRVFSPWEYNVDPVAATMLAADGWVAPDRGRVPDRAPRSSSATSSRWRRCRRSRRRCTSRARVVAVTKHGVDKLKDAGRDEAPFELIVEEGGEERRYLASAVIDASGTWTRPNPLGAGGVPAQGERERRGPDRLRHPGRARRRPGALRGSARARGRQRPFGLQRDPRPGDASRLRAVDARSSGPSAAPRRAASTAAAATTSCPRAARSARRCAAWSRTARSSSSAGSRRARVSTADGRVALADEDVVIGPTRSSPPPASARTSRCCGELRLDLDDRVEAARALAPLIDPNLHSCGSVPPHGVDELGHPDEGVYMVGMKSYGRAPTFLLRTGYEQVRSIVAALAGDWESARRVELVLPETGVCSVSAAPARHGAGAAASACCGSGSPHADATAAA